MLEKIKALGIDLFITIIDEHWHNKYIVEDYQAHANYYSFKLTFTFEDWSGIIGDGKEHMNYIGEYVNAKGGVLIKYQSEDFDELLQKLAKWCDEHRVE